MSKKHRTLAIRSAANANSDINITPLVDVVLVLLIIFMVVTPLLEKDILVKVPSTEKVETVTDVPPDQLLIRLLRTGELKLNGNPIDINELTEKLRAMMNGKKPEDKVVFVSPDEDANYGRLIMVLDRAKEAGAEALGMTTEPPPAEEPKLAFARNVPRPAGPEARGARALCTPGEPLPLRARRALSASARAWCRSDPTRRGGAAPAYGRVRAPRSTPRTAPCPGNARDARTGGGGESSGQAADR